MRRRLLISYLTLTLVVLVMLEVPLALAFRQRETEALQAQLERDAFVLSTFAEDSLDGSANPRLQVLAEEYLQETGGRVVFVDSNAVVRADSSPPNTNLRSFESRPEIQAALDRRVATGTRSSTTLGTDIVFAAVPITSGGTIQGVVRVSCPLSDLDERVERYWALLALIGAAVMAAVTMIGVLLARWVTRPVEELQQTAMAIGRGELSARAPANEGPPEVQRLARALNVTASRLEELVVAQEQFVADASHQLRTPLTALRLRLEMLEMHSRDDVMDSDLAAAEREVIRLSRLVDGLLALARADRSPGVGVIDGVDVDAALRERAANWRPVADTRDVRLVTHEAGLTARVDPDRLDQIIDNYVANAIDVAPAGSVVTLYSTMADNPDTGPMVAIHVQDEGPGLTPDQRSRAFDRFWRYSDTSGPLGGTGLGLPIVRKLANMDGGFADLDEAPGGGLDAVVTVPPTTGDRRA